MKEESEIMAKPVPATGSVRDLIEDVKKSRENCRNDSGIQRDTEKPVPVRPSIQDEVKKLNDSVRMSLKY